MITDNGAALYLAKALGTSTAAATGMKLGTSATAPAKNGAGAVLGAYLPGSNVAFTSQPTVTGNTVTFTCTWPAGVATTKTPIAEVVLVTDAATNATSPASATVARALIDPAATKAAGDTLTVTLTHTIGA